ncbi:hypothetical protein NEAUS03_0820 [Nematocida ausubeli]|nr:hypothetical protein NEAUS03_0820 [Nematocida ausubeli]
MRLDIRLESREVKARKQRAHKIRQEENRRAVKRAKIYMLIGLAMLCHLLDSMLTVERLRSVQVKAATFNEKEEIHRPNRMMPQMIRKEDNYTRLLHKKRFLSPEIKIHYHITVSRNSKGKLEFTKTRNSSLDRVRDTLLHKGAMLKYRQGYFSTLLELFPSIEESVSILSEKEDSFFSFINKAAVKEHKHKILASLLLLAEGIYVPLSIDENENRTEIVLRTANGGGEHFRLNMSAFVKTYKEDAEYPYMYEKMPERGAVGVVKFFIENQNNRVLRKEGYISESPFCKEFRKDKFINSPGFLIQMYIHHCIEDGKEIASFIESMHDLLAEYTGQKEGPVKRARNYVQSKCMAWKEGMLGKSGEPALPEKQFLTGVNCIDVIHKKRVSIYNGILNSWLGVLHLEPIADTVPIQKNTKKTDQLVSLDSKSKSECNPNEVDSTCGKESKPAEGFTGYGETALLGLFCWALYNCEENIYTVDHIESASEELKSFFRKYPKVGGGMSKEMHN